MRAGRTSHPEFRNSRDDGSHRFTVVEELVVTGAFDEQPLAVGKEGATRNDAIVTTRNRQVRYARLGAAKPREECAPRFDVAGEVAGKQAGAGSSLEGTCDADGPNDARITAELGHEPACREPSDAVTNEMDPELGRPKTSDDVGEPPGDALDAEPRRVRERRRGNRHSALDGVTQRPKHSGRREETVHENDDVATFRVGNDGENIAVEEGCLAGEGEGFAGERAQASRDHCSGL